MISDVCYWYQFIVYQLYKVHIAGGDCYAVVFKI